MTDTEPCQGVVSISASIWCGDGYLIEEEGQVFRSGKR
jgi:hypothetical protein